jgi:hypothetical protein
MCAPLTPIVIAFWEERLSSPFSFTPCMNLLRKGLLVGRLLMVRLSIVGPRDPSCGAITMIMAKPSVASLISLSTPLIVSCMTEFVALKSLSF